MAYVPETPTTTGLSDAALAAQMGVHVDAIAAHRAGVPHWRLQKDLQTIAAGFATDYLELKAKVDRDIQRLQRVQTFASAGRESYREMIQ